MANQPNQPQKQGTPNQPQQPQPNQPQQPQQPQPNQPQKQGTPNQPQQGGGQQPQQPQQPQGGQQKQDVKAPIKRGSTFGSALPDNVQGTQRVHALAQGIGFDPQKILDIFNKLEGPIKAIFLAIIDLQHSTPQLAAASGPDDFQYDENLVRAAAQAQAIDPQALMQLLQTLAPILGQLLLTLFTKPNIANA